MLGTSEMLDKLREEGYRVSMGYLQYLLRERFVEPPTQKIGGNFVWTEQHVEDVRTILERKGRGPSDTGGTSQADVE